MILNLAGVLKKSYKFICITLVVTLEIFAHLTPHQA